MTTAHRVRHPDQLAFVLHGGHRRLGHLLGSGRQRCLGDPLRHLGLHEAGGGRRAPAPRTPSGPHRGPGRTRRNRPWWSRRRSWSGAPARPATLDRATITPCDWARSGRFATAHPRCTGAAKLTSASSRACSASCQARRLASPSRPNATTAMSMSPAANAASMVAACEPWSARVQVDFDDPTAEPTELGRGLAPARGRPGRQHHPQPAAPCVAAGNGQGDVGGAAEQQQRLRRTERVQHGGLSWGGQSSSRRARSELNMPLGSTRRRTARKSSSRGYIWAKRPALNRESLAR